MNSSEFLYMERGKEFPKILFIGYHINYRFITITYGWFPFRLGALSLPLRFRTDENRVTVASLSHRAKIPGGVR